MSTSLAIRPLDETDIVVRELQGYYIKRMYEYPPLRLLHCVKLRRWNESGGIDPGDATRQALDYFNAEVRKVAEHIAGLRTSADGQTRLDEITHAFDDMLVTLKPDQRVAAMAAIGAGFCRWCGDQTGGQRCQCSNDE